MIKFVQFLHIVPLFFIAMIFLYSWAKKSLGASGSVNSFGIYPALLLLSAIGITAGSLSHDHSTDIQLILDPCLAYSGVITFVAIKFVSFLKASSSNNKSEVKN